MNIAAHYNSSRAFPFSTQKPLLYGLRCICLLLHVVTICDECMFNRHTTDHGMNTGVLVTDKWSANCSQWLGCHTALVKDRKQRTIHSLRENFFSKASGRLLVGGVAKLLVKQVLRHVVT